MGSDPIGALRFSRLLCNCLTGNATNKLLHVRQLLRGIPNTRSLHRDGILTEPAVCRCIAQQLIVILYNNSRAGQNKGKYTTVGQQSQNRKQPEN